MLSTANCNTLDCLRNLPTDVLKNATQQVYEDAYQQGLYAYGDFYFGPSVDGHVIRNLPSQEFKQGHFAKVPMLVDHNGYEGYLYSNRSETAFEQADAGLRKLLPAGTDSFFTRLYQLYPQTAFNSTLFQRLQIFGDIFVNCPTVRLHKRHRASRQPLLTSPPSITWPELSATPGYQHTSSSSMPAVSSTAPLRLSSSTRAPPVVSLIPLPPRTNLCDNSTLIRFTVVNNVTIAHHMKDWFISFVTDLDPNAVSYSGVDKPFWPQYNAGPGGNNKTKAIPEFAVMDVNYTQIGVIPDLDSSARCDFLHGGSFDVRN